MIVEFCDDVTVYVTVYDICDYVKDVQQTSVQLSQSTLTCAIHVIIIHVLTILPPRPPPSEICKT